MPSSENIPNTERADVSRIPAYPGGLVPPLSTPPETTDHERLKERAVEARMRTMELISRYLELTAHSAQAIAASLEERANRDSDRDALGASVTRYTLLLRALGEPPERTLVLIKSAFSEAAPQPDASHRAMLEQVVRWAVDAYYAA